MGTACICLSACPCHESPIARLEQLGVNWRAAKLSAMELALVAALVPAGTLRTYGWLWNSLHPGELWIEHSSSWHVFTVHAARIRPKLRGAGLTIETVPGIGMRLVPLDARQPQADRGVNVQAFLGDAARQRQALGCLQGGASQAAAALAVGLTAQQFAEARKRSTALDGGVLDALQAARRDRENREAATPPRAARPSVAQDLGDGLCQIQACGRPLSAHVRCPDCTVLAGPGHELLALQPGALCPACYEHARRRSLASAPRPVDWRTERAYV